jgi:chaperonin GroES
VSEVPGTDTDSRMPVRMLFDRILVRAEADSERRSGAGIVIPATATMGRRLGWAEVVAVGQHVRQVQVGDRVLFDPEDKAEVELHATAYVVLRERDLHAVAAARVPGGGTGLYL